VWNAPGIVSATFTTDEGGTTLNLFLFQTEERHKGLWSGYAARRDPRSCAWRRVELREVLAHF
jgi:hypothetical protein